MKRSVSGYLFRGHSPNWDRFNVRKEFPNFPSQKPKYTFDQYLNFTEYHNIITRMMAHNSFPYRNIEVNHKDMLLAKERLALFKMIGIQEAFEASVRLMLHKFGVKIPHEVWSKTYTAVPLKSSATKAPKKVRFMGQHVRAKPPNSLPGGGALPDASKLTLQPFPRARKAAELKVQEKQAGETNSLDMQLYQWAVGNFCSELCEAGLMQYDDNGVCKDSPCR